MLQMVCPQTQRRIKQTPLFQELFLKSHPNSTKRIIKASSRHSQAEIIQTIQLPGCLSLVHRRVLAHRGELVLIRQVSAIWSISARMISNTKNSLQLSKSKRSTLASKTWRKTSNLRWTPVSIRLTLLCSNICTRGILSMRTHKLSVVRIFLSLKRR